MNQLTFDETTHTYRVGQRKLPSVTTIINTIFPPWEVGQFFLSRGSALHKACHLSDLGQLDIDTVHPEIKPQLMAWQKFRAEIGQHSIRSSETPLHSDLWQFAGTPDRILWLGSETVIVDIKQSYGKQVLLQLGAYALLFEEKNSSKVSHCMCVQLKPMGGYSLTTVSHEHLRYAKQSFLNVLGAYNFGISAGLLKPRIERSF